MNTPRKLIAQAAVAALIGACAAPSNAQGIPVWDIDQIIQTMLTVNQSLQQIENQIQQIEQLQSQIKAISGMRNLGQILNSPLLQNYVPSNAVAIYSTLESGGYSGLSGTGKALRDARMTYNCLEKEGDARTNCQSTLASPYQQKAFMTDAMTAAKGRIAQIQSLMGQIDATVDPKGVAEIQARIAAENALIQHEQTQIEMAKGVADSEQRIELSRNKESQMEQANRAGSLADYAK